jgi:WD40 repeat protein
VDLHGHVVATGGGDNLVKLWDLRSGECVSSLTSHTNKIRGVQLVGHLLASGSGFFFLPPSSHLSPLLSNITEDKTVKFVDTRKMSATTLVESMEFPSPVNSMHFEGLRLVVATMNGVCFSFMIHFSLHYF